MGLISVCIDIHPVPLEANKQRTVRPVPIFLVNTLNQRIMEKQFGRDV